MRGYYFLFNHSSFNTSNIPANRPKKTCLKDKVKVMKYHKRNTIHEISAWKRIISRLSGVGKVGVW